jgi:hypothetical protein
MDEKTLAALASSVVAIIIAVVSLATARLNRSLILKAEEKAKRGELVRAKGLEVTDTLLDAIWEVIRSIGNVRSSLRNDSGLDIEDSDANKEWEEIVHKLKVLSRLRFRTAPYLSEELDSQLDRISRMREWELTKSFLDHKERELEEIAKAISAICRKEYLS